jgi:hypothetical protein
MYTVMEAREESCRLRCDDPTAAGLIRGGQSKNPRSRYEAAAK